MTRDLGIEDRTTFLGWMPNKALPPYFRGCAVSVIPSLEEGFGIPAAEAMGCEAPVVATDAGGLPEVVEDGVTGYVVPKGNTEALRAAMDRILGDPALGARMGKAGRQRALERFDWDRSVTQFDAVYRHILGRDKGVQILKTSYEFPPLGGGGAKVVNGLARHLVARGHSVDVLTMGFRGLPATEDVAGVHIRRVPGIRLRISSCSFIEMIPYVLLAPLYVGRERSKQYIINHTHFIFPGGIVAYILKRLTGLPYVVTAHGSDVPNFNPNRFRLLHRILRPIWRKIARDASLIICPSRSIEDLIKTSSSEARTYVIPNAIDTNKFLPRDKNPRRVLIVTRMFERKGVQYALQALAGMGGRFDVEIVGDGPYLPTLKNLAENLKIDVRFWGHLDNDSAELKDLYETAAIFVFTSEAENFPIVLLEAMIAGAAIVTTEGTGCAEVVGDAALLVPVRDADAIREAVNRLASDPALAASLGQSARSRVIKNFGWDGVVDQHLEVYAKYGVGVSAASK
jgi:glycosyltransferase involved in cell wall biosynthesis